LELLRWDCIEMNEVETAINLMHSQHDNPGANEMSQSMVRLLSLDGSEEELQFLRVEEGDEDHGGVGEGVVVECSKQLLLH
jgi:hypothetical protein